MKRLLLLLWLHLRSLARPGIIIVFVLLAPLLLGLVAGYGNKMNYSTEVRVAIVDLDESEESARLQTDLAARGWQLHAVDGAAAGDLLAMGSVGAVMRIGPQYDAFVQGRAASADIHFEQTDQSLMQVTIRQSVLLYAESRRTETEMRQNIRAARARAGDSVESLDADMSALIEHYRKNEGAMPIHYENRAAGPLRRTLAVADFSLEAFYLAVLAVLAVTSQKPLRTRLLSIPGAAPLSVVLSYLVWLVLGLIQIVLFTAAMAWAMNDATLLQMISPLVAAYALILALAGWLHHLATDIALYLGLFLAFLLSLVGGVFFPLPGPMLTEVARYTPLGWIYAYQSGLADLPVWSVWLSAAAMLAVVAFSFSRPYRKRA